jgi:hypothetical protein
LIKTLWIFFVSLCLTLSASGQTPAPTKPTVPSTKKSAHKPIKKKLNPAVQAQTTPLATATTVKTVVAPSNSSTWTKAWTDKYVIVTSKSEYTHVLIDVEPLRSTFEGSGMHSAALLEVIQLTQSSGLLNPASDLIKVDVVAFKNRDNYGAPMWDSMQRFAHFEFSLKAILKTPADAFQKPESDWKGLFQSVLFY